MLPPLNGLTGIPLSQCPILCFHGTCCLTWFLSVGTKPAINPVRWNKAPVVCRVLQAALTGGDNKCAGRGDPQRPRQNNPDRRGSDNYMLLLPLVRLSKGNGGSREVDSDKHGNTLSIGSLFLHWPGDYTTIINMYESEQKTLV